MLSVENLLSLTRIPLAFTFLQANVSLRVATILLAIATDILDGYLARKRNRITQFGAMLDPIADKFFVIFALSILAQENSLSKWEIGAMLCRDFAVFLFGIFLLFKNKLSKYKFRSIWCGKITTTLQFAVLLCLVMKYTIPPYFFISFIILGFAALIELALTNKRDILAN